MAITLQLADSAGNTRTITVNAGDTVELAPGEVIENIEGVDLSLVQIRIEGGTLFIGWPEGSITIPGYAEQLANSGAGSGADGPADSAAGEGTGSTSTDSAQNGNPPSSGGGPIAQFGEDGYGQSEEFDNGDGGQGNGQGNGQGAGSGLGSGAGSSDGNASPGAASGSSSGSGADPLAVGLNAGPALFSVSAASAREGANLQVVITRTGNLTKSVTVSYNFVDGSATNGLDYTGVSGTVVFEPGTVSKTITVPTLIDALAEGTETFSFALSTAATSEDAEIQSPSTTMQILNNTPPTTTPDAVAVNEDAVTANLSPALIGNDNANDPGDSLRIVAIDTAGTVGAVSLVAGAVRYTASGADDLAVGVTRTDTFTYTVADQGNATATETVTVTVTGVNDAPLAVDDTFATDEASVLPGDVLANDSDPDTGDAPMVTALNGSGAAIGVATALASGAQVTLNAGGTFSYDPNGAFEFLAAGGTQADSFTYTIDDGNGGTDTATATVTVTGLNDAPAIGGAVGAQATTDTATIDPFAAVTLSDVDITPAADSQTVTVSLDDATKGALSGGGFVETGVGTGIYELSGVSAAAAQAAIRTLTYTPAQNRVTPGATETTTFTISIDDGAGAVTDATTTVVSTSVNDPSAIGGAIAAQAVNDNATVDPFSALTITDVDNPAQTLSVSVTLDTAAKGALAGGGFADAGGGVYTFSGTAIAAQAAIRALTFTPGENRVTPGTTETTNFTVSVDDGSGAVLDASTSVVSTSINDVPVIAGAVASQAVNDNATIDPFAALTIVDVDNPAQTLSVSVTLDVAANGALSGGFVDAGGGVYTFSGTAAAAQAALQALTFTPSANIAAPTTSTTTTFTVSVDDGSGAVTDATTSVDSLSIDDAPTAVTDTFSVSNLASAFPLDVIGAGGGGADVHPDILDPLTITFIDPDGAGGAAAIAVVANQTVTLASGAELTVNATADGLLYDATTSATFGALVPPGSAPDVFGYTISDVAGNTSSTVVNMTVQTTNPPTATDDTFATDEDTSFSGANVITTDNGNGVDTDPDPGETAGLTILELDGAAGAVNVATAIASGATVTLQTDGSLDYDPSTSATLQGLADGVAGTDTFQYTLRDVPGATDFGTVTVNVTGVNDAPVIGGSVASQAVDDNATVDPFTGVTIFDADVTPAADLQTVRVSLDDASKGSLSGGGFAETFGGSGIYELSGVSAADAQTAIRTLTFTPTADRVTPGATETTTFTISVDDGTAAAVLDTVTTVISTSINDVPVIAGAVAAQAVNDTDTVDPFSAMTIVDADNPAQSLSVSVTLDVAANGALSVGDFTEGPAGVYTFTGTAAVAQAALQALTFTPAQNRVAVGAIETTTFTVSVDDGSGPITDAVTTVESTSINDPSTIAGAVAAQAVDDNATVDPFTALTIADVDNPAQTLSVLVTLDVAANGALAGGGFAETGVGTGVYELTGVTAAAAQAAIRLLTFTPAENRVAVGATETTTFTVSVDDGSGAVTDTATTVVSTSINDVPVALDDTVAATQNTVLIADAGRNLISGVGVGGAVDSDVDPGAVLTVTAGTISSTAGASVTLNADGTFSYDATAVAALVALSEGTTQTDTFTYTLNDGDGGTDTATMTVTVTGSNDAPVIAGSVVAQAVTDKTTLDPFTAVTITDADVTPGADTQIVRVALDDANKGSLAGGGFVETGVGTGIYEITGVTAAAAQAAIRLLTFTPAENRVTPAATETTTFTISVDDGVAAAVLDTVTTVVSTSVNDVPVIGGAVGSQAVNDNADVDPFSALTITDIDNPAQTLSVSVTLDVAANGALSVVDFSDDGGGVYSFSGTAAAAQAAIRALTFTPAENIAAPGAVTTTTFTVSVDDGSGAITDAATTVDSTSIDDPPVANTDTFTVGNLQSAFAMDVIGAGGGGADVHPDVGDALTITEIDIDGPGGVASAAVSANDLVVLASGATVTVSADATSLIYDANAGFSALAAGTTDTDVFSYTISDVGLNTSSADVNITVTTNVPPTAGADSITGNDEDSTTTIAIGTAGVSGLLLNDSDGDAPPDPVSLFGFDALSANGAAISQVGSDLIYDPTGAAALQALTSGQAFADTFNYQITDGVNSPVTGIVTVNITGVNDATVLAGDHATTVSEGANVTLTNVDLASTDPDDAATDRTFTITSAPSNGFVATTGAPGIPIASFSQDQINNNQIIYVHNGSETPADSFDFSLSDGGEDGAGASTGTFNLTVTAVNDAPVIAGDLSATVVEGSSVGITTADLTENDPDDDGADLTYTITSGPSNGFVALTGAPATPVTSFTQLQLENNEVTYVHDGSETLSDSFDFSLADGGEDGAAADTNTFSITVTAVDDPPTPGGDEAIALNEGATVTITSSDLNATDPDTVPGSLTYTVTSIPANGFIALTGAPATPVTSFTQAQVNSSTVIYVHDGSETLSDGFDVEVSDGTTTAAAQSVAVTVTAVNDAPVIAGDLSATVVEAGTVTITTADLTENDPDDDGAELTYTITSGPSNGFVALTGAPATPVTSFTQLQLENNEVTYVHDGSETLSDSFDFSLADGGEDGAAADTNTFSITVTAVDDPPTPGGDEAIALNEGATVTITSSDLNATDPDTVPGSLTYTVTSIPANGFIALTGAPATPVTSFTQAQVNSSTVIYVHDGSETLSDGFDVEVSDGTTTAAAQSVAVTVTAVNDAPVIAGDLSATVVEAGTVTITTADLTENDPDDDGADLTYTITSGPSNGFVALTGAPATPVTSFTQLQLENNEVTYVHDGSETLSDSFDFSLADGGEDGAAADTNTFSITVTAVDDPPTPGGDEAIALNEGATVTITSSDLNATDPDTVPGSLTYTVTSIPANGFIALTGAPATPVTSFTQAQVNSSTVIYVHDGSETLSDGFDVEVSDGTTTAAAQSVAVTVTAVNDAPVIAGDLSATVVEAGTVTITTADLTENDPDDDGADLTYTITSGPSNGFVALTGAPATPVTSFTQLQLENNEVTYVHDGSETLSDSFDFSLADGGEDGAAADTNTFSITVTAVDDPPTPGGDEAIALNEGATVTITSSDLNATDPDTVPGSLTYTVTSIPANGFIALTGAPATPVTSFTQAQVNSSTVIYVHDGSETLSDGFDVEVSDGTTTAAAQSVAVTVTAVNDAPVIAGDLSATVVEAGTVTITTADLTENDPDDDGAELTYTITSGPSNGFVALTGAPATPVTSFTQLQLENNEVTYVHDGSETLSDSFDFSLADGGEDGAAADTNTFSITVTAVDDPPTPGGDEAIALNEGATVTITSSDLNATDPDTVPGSLTYTVTSIPANGFIALTGAPATPVTSFTQAQVNSSTVIYVHDGSETLSDGFDVEVSDGTTTAAAQSVAVTVTAVNDAPVIAGDLSATVVEAGTVTITTADLTENDPDDDGAELTYTITSGPSNGFVALTGAPATPVTSFTQLQLENNEVTYVHDGSETLSDSFDFSLADGGEDGAAADTNTFSITVTAVDDPPTPGGDEAIALNEGATVTITSSDLNATDPDTVPGSLTYTVTSIPVNGFIAISGAPGVPVTSFTQAQVNSSLVLYVHDGSETTSDTFDVEVSDGTTTAATQSVSVAVTAVNDAPAIAGDLSATVNEGATVVITTTDLTENDPDDDAASGLTYTITSGPANGFVALTGAPATPIASFTQAQLENNEVTYVHNGSETLSDSFDFSLADGGEDGAAAASSTFNITVTALNDAPDPSVLVLGLAPVDSNDDTPDSQITTVTDLVANATVTDPDTSSGTLGIAVTVASNAGGTGFWQYEPSGGGVFAVGTVSGAGALLLAPGAQLRYVPSDNETGTATLSFRIWDQSDAGTEGAKVDVDTNGDPTAFSSDLVTSTHAVAAANDAPTAADDGPGGLPGITEDGGIVAIPIASLTANDDDADLLEDGSTLTVTAVNTATAGVSVAINGANIDYDPGTAFQNLGAGVTTTDTFTYTVEDAASAPDTATVTVTVTGVNDAPVVGAAGPSDLGSIDSNDLVPEFTTTTVASLIAGATVSDADDGAAQGIAITGLTGSGLWEYEPSGGGGFLDLSALTPSDSSALLLATGGNLRYTPSANEAGTASVVFRAWDQSSGSDGDTAVNTSGANNGGVTAFSTATHTAQHTLAAVNDVPVFSNLDGTPTVDVNVAVALDTDVTIADADLDALNGGAGDYAGASFTVSRNGGANAEDTYEVVSGGSIVVTGNTTIAVGADDIATINTGVAGAVTVTFANNGTAPTTALVNEVMQALQYTNTGAADATVQLDYTFSDGNAGGAQGSGAEPGQATGSVTVTVEAVATGPIDLTTLDGTEGFIVLGSNPGGGGATPGGGAGSSVTLADVDGDGRVDVITGEPLADPNTGSTVFNNGQVSILFGVDDPTALTGVTGSGFDLATLDGSDGFQVLADGAGQPGRQMGAFVAAGDVNGDGRSEVLIGQNSLNGSTQPQHVYGITGNTQAALDTLHGAGGFTVTAVDGSNGFELDGAASTRSLYTVASGDVNNDGFDDIAIGDPLAGPSNLGQGLVSVVLGEGTLSNLDDTDVNGSTSVMQFFGRAGQTDFSGFANAIGDIDNDGVGDLIVGSPFNSGAGRVYVVLGSAIQAAITESGGDISTPGSLASVFQGGFNLDSLTGGDGSKGFVIFGAFGSKAGTSVAVADMNGDGFGDVIVGAPAANGGAVYVLFGKAGGFADVDLDAAASGWVKITTTDFGSTLGQSVASAGNVNSDTNGGNQLQDIVIGQPGENSAYIIYGNAALADISVNTLGAAGVELNGAANTRTGQAVGGGGDFNNDGFDDVIIGAPDADKPGGAASDFAGHAYVVYGGPTSTVYLGDGDDVYTDGDDSEVILGEGGNDQIFGGGGDDSLIGGLGNDWLDGQAGADLLKGAAGDDHLVFDIADAGADGGAGVDTLHLIGDQSVDLSALGEGRLQSLERIELGSGAQNLNLSVEDLMDMVANPIPDLPGALAESSAVLVIDGDATDSVSVSGWGASNTASLGDVLYDGSVYSHYSNGTAHLLLDQQVTQHIIA